MVLAQLLRAGYIVLVPYNVMRYDLGLDVDGQLKRVQVKTARVLNGALVFNPYSITGGKRIYYTADEIDLFGVYSPELDKTYLVPFADGKGTLRLEAARNGQTAGVRWAAEYEI